MAQGQSPDIFYRLVLCGCGLGLISSLYLLAGWMGLLDSSLLNLGSAFAVMVAGIFFLQAFLAPLRARSRIGLLLWFLVLIAILLEGVLSLVPPTARDELTHHLALPRLYVQSGRIFGISFAPYSYYPMLLDMLYAPWLRWGWDSVPKLIHGLFAFMTGAVLYAYLARRLSPAYGLAGFVFYIFTPAILRLSHVAYVDLGLAFYSTASLLCLLRWLENVDEKRWLVLGALSAGFALATKPNGLLAFFILLSLLAYASGGAEGRGWKHAFSVLFLFSALALLAFSPWPAKNLMETGNPLFPFFTGWLGGVLQGTGEPGLSLLAQRSLLYGESWLQIAALPLRVFFSGQDDKPQFFDGVLSPLLILFLPWAFKGKWSAEKRLMFYFALFYFLYALFLSDLRIRYVLPIVPPLVILLVYGIHNVYLSIARPVVLFTVVVALSALNGAYLWRYFQAISPVGYLEGSESRETYLSRMLPEYPAFRFINRTLPSTAKIYLVFMGRRTYYCEREYFHDPGDNAWTLLRMIERATDEGDVLAGLSGQGLTHLLVREDLLGRFLRNNLDAGQLGIWDSFLARRLELLFRERGYSVYQVHA